jgi:hypothetical protein
VLSLTRYVISLFVLFGGAPDYASPVRRPRQLAWCLLRWLTSLSPLPVFRCEQLLSVCVLLLTVIIIVELVWANKGSPVCAACSSAWLHQLIPRGCAALASPQSAIQMLMAHIPHSPHGASPVANRLLLVCAHKLCCLHSARL